MSAQMGIRLPDEHFEQLDQIAAELHNTRSGIIRLAIDQFLDARRKAVERREREPELFDHTSTADVVAEEREPQAVNFSVQPPEEKP